MSESAETIMIPVSPGELLDKISILQIKSEKLKDPAKRLNVNRELALLEDARRAHLSASVDYLPLLNALKRINEALWDVEEGKRICEQRKTFDEHFISLAREVYLKNDDRAAIKRQINELFGSTIIEEKSYDEAPLSSPVRR